MKKLRTIVVGDIHGCLNTLMKLMVIIKPQPEDEFIFLGDYIDRGKFSFEVIDYLIDFKRHIPNTTFLMGNHEHMFIDYFRDNAIMYGKSCFGQNGGEKTILSYKQNGCVESYRPFSGWATFNMPDDHLEFFNNLEMIKITPKHIFVHAGMNPKISLNMQKDDDLLWIRDEFLSAKKESWWGKIVVHGHTPLQYDDYAEIGRINVDYGCVYGGSLAAYDVESGMWNRTTLVSEDVE